MIEVEINNRQAFMAKDCKFRDNLVEVKRIVELDSNTLRVDIDSPFYKYLDIRASGHADVDGSYLKINACHKYEHGELKGNLETWNCTFRVPRYSYYSDSLIIPLKWEYSIFFFRDLFAMEGKKLEFEETEVVWE